jgi:GntR family transcriptional regulator/MocR family aminotransferase
MIDRMRTVAGGFSPVIAVDRNAAKPLHSQIYDGYRAAIIGRSLRCGQQVPSTRTLAAELGISRIPALNAYAQLVAEGYFESRTGAGTFVSSALPEQLLSCVNRAKIAPAKRSTTQPASRRSALIPGLESEPWVYGSGAFSVGQLTLEHFPFGTWSKLLARQGRKTQGSFLNYSDPMGSMDFRECIAAYLRTARAVRCEARQIMIVSGSQQALDLCARVLLDPGSRVWAEDPGYYLMRSALTLAGCILIPVPVDSEGLDVAAGIRLCRKAQAAFVTPSHQYPLGATMSASRRFQLLEWARSAGAWIVEDDYDSEYRYESMPVSSLQGLDQDSRVVYIGTFSKTLFPSLRVGYMVIPTGLVDRFAAVRRATDLCPPQMCQAVLADFIREGHFTRHIRRTRLLYKERRSVLVQEIRNELGTRVEVVGGDAGMHLVVMLPESLRDREISMRAAKRGLWLWPLSPAYLAKPSHQGLILGFGSTRTSDIRPSIRRLRSILNEDVKKSLGHCGPPSEILRSQGS